MEKYIKPDIMIFLIDSDILLISGYINDNNKDDISSDIFGV